MISATLVKQVDVDSVWPSISDALIKCLEKTPSYFSAADAWVMCRTGEGFLFVIHDQSEIIGSAVWRFEQESFVCLLMAGSRMDEWAVELYDAARLVASSGGASQLTASGRVGLFKKLKKKIPSIRMIRCTVAVEV